VTLVLLTDIEGRKSAIIACPGKVLRWHVWMAVHLLDVPALARVTLCQVDGERPPPSLGAAAMKRVALDDARNELPLGTGERLMTSRIAPTALRELAASAEVWTYQIGSIGGRPPLLQEIARGDLAITVALQREGAEPGFALQTGTFGVRATYARTIDYALRAAAHWPAKLLRLASLGVEPQATFEPRLVERKRKHANATLLDFAGYGLTSAKRLISNVFEYFFVVSRWNIGVVEAPISLPLPLSSVSWLPVEPGYFVADPMIIAGRGEREIFCEYYPFSTERGEVAVVAMNGHAMKPVSVITHASHMSYPFMLEHEGEFYCLPENSRAGELTLYRARRYPYEWEKVATIVENVPAIDPTIVRHDDRWWLFATRADSNHNTNLFVWHAENLLGPWHEHAANPVKSDVMGSRPAGNFFRVGGELYRPAQDCSQSYGGAVTIHRILELTPTRFREAQATRINPIPPYLHGLHTISSSGDRFVIDGRRDFINPRKAIWAARRVFSRLTKSRA
jgi:hypothetical protein